MRMFTRALDGLVVIGGLDRVIAAKHFFGFAVGSISHTRFASFGPQHAAFIVGKPQAVYRERLLCPGHVFLDGLLHLLRTYLGPIGGIVTKQEHESRHVVLSLSYPDIVKRFRRFLLTILVELPFGDYVVLVHQLQRRVVHMTVGRRGKV